MTHAHSWMPLVMGAGMGLMLPFMIHDGAGAMFVLAHVAAALIIASLALVSPRLRRMARAHLNRAHLIRMGGGMAAGVAAICVYCLMIGGSHWI